MSKMCSSCKKEKELSCFNKDKNKKDGLGFWCKPCNKKYKKEYQKINKKQISIKKKKCYQNNKSKIRKKQKIYRSKNLIKILLQKAKERAEKKNIEFNIINEYTIPNLCPIFNVPFVLNAENYRKNYSPSIDRIDNLKGYIDGNIKIISFRANTLKSDATKEEIGKIIDYMKNSQNNEIIENKKIIISKEIYAKLCEILYNSKYRSKKNNIVNTLTINDLLELTYSHCPVFGIEMNYLNKDKPKNNSMSLDRFDNNQGYTKKNIRIISYRANFLKRNASLEELELIYKNGF